MTTYPDRTLSPWDPGDIKASARSSAPPGWLLCDGSLVSRSTYASLFAAIGTTYGVGDGSTTFGLPDYRGRTIIGAGTGSGLTDRTLGATGGEENHQLTTAEMASHTHASAGAHTHGAGGNGFVRDRNSGGTVNLALGGGPPLTKDVVADTSSDGAHTHGSVGSDTAHNNMQPYAVANVFIKT